MAITKLNPRTIWLGGPPIVIVNELAAAAPLMPGILIERSGGTYRANTIAGTKSPTFALDQPELNFSFDRPYGAGDLVVAGIGKPGSTFLAWLASGQNVLDGAPLSADATGKFVASTGAAATLGIALENKNSAGGDARIRIEVV